MSGDKKQYCKVRRCAFPINIDNGAKKAVLCIHGFTGYPGEMAYPVSRLAENGWDIRTPRLIGHGTCGSDFSAARVDDWTRQLKDIWLDLKSRYEVVAVLGHSLGGLLALYLAEEYPVDILALLAPAIGVRSKWQGLLRPFSWFKERIKIPWKADPEYTFFDERDEGDDEFLGGEYWCWAWIRKLAQLLVFQRQVERKLSLISCPVLDITAENDEVVGQGSLEVLKDGLSVEFKSLELKGCRHFIPYDPNPGSKEEAMDAVLEWFSRF